MKKEFRWNWEIGSELEKARLLTVVGRGERERLGRSWGFILARIKIDKAFLFIFSVSIYTRNESVCVIVWEIVISGQYNGSTMLPNVCWIVSIGFLARWLYSFHFHVLLSVACNLSQTPVYSLRVYVPSDRSKQVIRIRAFLYSSYSVKKI